MLSAFPIRPKFDDPRWHAWARAVEEGIQLRPSFSLISTADGPNTSGQTGSPGDLITDIGSSVTRLWQKHSTSTSTIGWVQFEWL